MKIAILDDYQDTVRTLPAFALLAGHDVTVWTDHVSDPEVLAARLADTDALVLFRERTAVGADLLDRLPTLALISQISAVPHVDVDACTRLGIVVSSRLGGSMPSFSTAELTWGLVIAAARRIPQQVASLRSGGWQDGIGHMLFGRTLGVYGYGRLGRTVAGYGRAFGMTVRVWGRDASRDAARADDFEVCGDRDELFATSDVVTLHLRLVPETTGIVTQREFALMGPDAVFVNTSRAGLVAPGALEAALDMGRPAVAAIDVFDEEPLPAGGSRLVGRDDVVATPHIGFVTREELDVHFRIIFEQVLAFAAGTPINVVDPAALSRARGLA
jgi:D-3-phosphoglycerate dehydrogenase / 2-oxoglutarate reductase